jgi:hypothetical protein
MFKNEYGLGLLLIEYGLVLALWTNAMIYFWFCHVGITLMIIRFSYRFALRDRNLRKCREF